MEQTEQELIAIAKKTLKDIDFWTEDFLDVHVTYLESDEISKAIYNNLNDIWQVSLDYKSISGVIGQIFVIIDSLSGKTVGPIIYKYDSNRRTTC